MKSIKRIRNILASMVVKLGYYPRLHTPDRQYLEEIILPHFSKIDDFKNILFIGCEWYTKYYELFFNQKNYYTIDNDVQKKKYGSKLHIIDKIQNIHQYFSENSLNLIICNGVIGWGLNNFNDAEETFSHLFHCLKLEGIFVLGWNDVPEHRPFLLEDSHALEKFSRHSFPPINTWRHKINTKNSHVYDFYQKV
jgi:hypothetical protein